MYKKENEHMRQLLSNGNCLKAGIVRGDVVVREIPKQSVVNDFAMRLRSGILYGPTKYEDVQILYFYIKHNGNVSAASRDLRMSYLAFRRRLPRMGLEPKGMPGSYKREKWYSDKVIKKAMEETNNNIAQAAKNLKCSRVTMRKRAKDLGLKTHGPGRR
jgi:transcriptional regulator of acetoin/glycerol metabolism